MDVDVLEDVGDIAHELCGGQHLWPQVGDVREDACRHVLLLRVHVPRPEVRQHQHRDLRPAQTLYAHLRLRELGHDHQILIPDHSGLWQHHLRALLLAFNQLMDGAIEPIDGGLLGVVLGRGEVRELFALLCEVGGEVLAADLFAELLGFGFVH